ncbi:MAG: histidine phosphatase family protein [Cypionkella sp.]
MTSPRIVRYLSHPQVRIDPQVAVGLWSLSPVGRARVAALAGSGVLRGTTRVISSAEVKARETAGPLAAALGCVPEVRPDMHENDRTATGFVPEAEFETLADAFFAFPDRSVKGWETARDAQTRILRAMRACLAADGGGDVGDLLIVGHGAVGTLLYCALSGLPISRLQDQPAGGGNVWTFRRESQRPIHGWTPMEALLR